MSYPAGYASLDRLSGLFVAGVKLPPTFFALAVNGPWRITFEWEDGDALHVDLEQYH